MIDKDKLKKSLTIEQVHDLVSELGGEPQPIKGNSFISKTICHNPIGQGSYKLYYYDNGEEGLFHCYTGCENGSFDIYELVRKQKTINTKEEWPLSKAIIFVANYFGYTYQNFDILNNHEEVLPDWKVLERYESNSEPQSDKRIELKIFDSSILAHLPQPRILPWEEEGINREVMLHRGIAYDPVSQGIVIPHYDINGNLIGIRERTLVKEEEENGKYRPAFLNYQLYNHPLSFNLYNLNNSKEHIKEIKKAIIGEGEKFCLTFASYFGEDKDITVACCGSSLISYQVQLLLSLGVEEIIIAFDKQFKVIGDDEFKRWVKKLKDINKKYSKYVSISFMFDKWNMLEYKDSPIDKTKEIFLELFNRRIFL